MNEVTALVPIRGTTSALGNIVALSSRYAHILTPSSTVQMVENTEPLYTGPDSGELTKLVVGGKFTGTVPTTYLIDVVTAGSDVVYVPDTSDIQTAAIPATIRFSTDGGANWSGAISVNEKDRTFLDNGVYVVLYRKFGYSVGAQWTFSYRLAAFDDSAYTRWQVTPYEDGWFFLNSCNGLKYTEGQQVYNFSSPAQRLPAGTYLEMFGRHLVIGKPVVDGHEFTHRVMWSDVHNYFEYNPNPENEADFYELDSTVDVIPYNTGITGIKKIADGCAVYTNRSIYMLRYVGQPFIMRLDDAVTEVGCNFPFSVVGYNKEHAFISEENFWRFDGVAAVPIGNAIRDIFFADVSEDPSLRYRTWGYINRPFGEIWWVYVSKRSTGPFDRAIVYNFEENKWYVAEVEDVQSALYTTFLDSATVIDDLDNFIDQYNNVVIDQLGNEGTFNRLGLYGSSDLNIWRDEVPNDDITELLPQTAPYAETNDMIFGDLEYFKEGDTMAIHADYPDGYPGLEVSFSGRPHIQDAVVFEGAKMWTKDLPEKRLSFPRMSGRVFRYKFVFKDNGNGGRNMAILAYADNIRQRPKSIER